MTNKSIMTAAVLPQPRDIMDGHKTGSVKDLSSRKFKGQHENTEEKSRRT